MNEEHQSQVLFEHKDHVATITLNRPEKHNAFNDQIIAKLLDCIETCRKDPSMRVLVLQANGKNFSAGADLAWMKRMAKLDYNDNLKDAKQLAKLMKQLHDLPIPTIAKVQGAAYGGAIGLISCCDIAIATDTAKFCLSEVKLGLAPATIGPFVIKAMGARRCRRLFITAEVFNAAQAEEWGLVHERVASANLENHVDDLVTLILRNGPKACAEAKQLIGLVENMYDHSEATSAMIAGLRVSEEGQEGLSAFFEKRPAAWIND